MDKFIRHGLLLPCQSLYNVPILPVIEPNEEYRMVQDLRVVNDIVVSIPLLVANPYNILTQSLRMLNGLLYSVSRMASSATQFTPHESLPL